jgi:hypothetical protein
MILLAAAKKAVTTVSRNRDLLLKIAELARTAWGVRKHLGGMISHSGEAGL